MIPLLVLALAVGEQAELSAQPGPRERFIICPGDPRCPPRPSRPGAVVGLVAGALLGIRRENSSFVGGVGSASRTGTRLDFGSGDAALTPAARETIEGIARQMAANPRLEVFIEGHADRRGTEAANVELAGRRAAAAAAYLTERGVATDRMTTISWGEAGADTPAEDGDDARDRRVVITLRSRARPTLRSRSPDRAGTPCAARPARRADWRPS